MEKYIARPKRVVFHSAAVAMNRWQPRFMFQTRNVGITPDEGTKYIGVKLFGRKDAQINL